MCCAFKGVTVSLSIASQLWFQLFVRSCTCKLQPQLMFCLKTDFYS